jgi:hypothetical protein
MNGCPKIEVGRFDKVIDGVGDGAGEMARVILRVLAVFGGSQWTIHPNGFFIRN